MYEEERDYILRQIQTTARGLGKFLGIEAIKEIIGYEQISDANVLDEEIETIMLMTKIEEIMFNRELTLVHLSKELNVSITDIENLFNNERIANIEERSALSNFINNNKEYLQ